MRKSDDGEEEEHDDTNGDERRVVSSDGSSAEEEEEEEGAVRPVRSSALSQRASLTAYRARSRASTALSWSGPRR